MAKAADGKKLGNTLNDRKNQGLNGCHGNSIAKMLKIIAFSNVVLHQPRCSRKPCLTGQSRQAKS
ncbi:hypothetical protein NCH01_16010 [Neoasaia chiangmaiensis]|nr:hypothetical protein NCH01_16010 [Neoasaia chiangmaiensis]